MATIKKTAAKPAAKTAAKPAAKPAAKAASKPAAKAATAKPAAKSAAKPAAKATAKSAAKPAAKSAAKPASKAAAKPASKAAAKPASKAAGAKATSAKKPAAKAGAKSAPKAAAKGKKSEEISDVKFRNLFDAYSQGKLPFTHGYIVSSFFNENSYYSKYEIVSYAGVKEIFPTADGLTFVTGGKKLHVLLEPDTYNKKFQEPVSRADGERIPKRFAELETITASNQSKIMVAKNPDESYGSFTILKPSGINFSIIFYQRPDVYKSLSEFFIDSLNRFRRVPAIDAKKAGALISSIVEKYMGFEGEFQ
ncbi:MAG: hypothetical protein FWC01_05325 [Treponema sp.]|nr:hypothetical protein [Treponema sp.]MCL2237443.1 hypothetical protein [Treponema sp.]